MKGNRRLWVIVVGAAAMVEELRSVVDACRSTMLLVNEPQQAPLSFFVTGLDFALRHVISLAWIAIVLYWIVHTYRPAGAEPT